MAGKQRPRWGNVTCPRSHGQFGREDFSRSPQRKEGELLGRGSHLVQSYFVEVLFPLLSASPSSSFLEPGPREGGGIT